jgi:hypothetical protein
MADRTLLEHDPIAPQSQMPELNLEFAEETAELLSYSKLKETLTRKKGFRELLQVLKELDIQPLSHNSVERYKAEQANAAELTDVPEVFKRHRKVARVLPSLIPWWVVLSAIDAGAGWLVSWAEGLGSQEASSQRRIVHRTTRQRPLLDREVWRGRALH